MSDFEIKQNHAQLIYKYQTKRSILSELAHKIYSLFTSPKIILQEVTHLIPDPVIELVAKNVDPIDLSETSTGMLSMPTLLHEGYGKNGTKVAIYQVQDNEYQVEIASLQETLSYTYSFDQLKESLEKGELQQLSFNGTFATTKLPDVEKEQPIRVSLERKALEYRKRLEEQVEQKTKNDLHAQWLKNKKSIYESKDLDSKSSGMGENEPRVFAPTVTLDDDPEEFMKQWKLYKENN